MLEYQPLNKASTCKDKLYDARKDKVVEICKIFNISRPTFYNYSKLKASDGRNKVKKKKSANIKRNRN
jgi:hypothetical protein